MQFSKKKNGAHFEKKWLCEKSSVWNTHTLAKRKQVDWIFGRRRMDVSNQNNFYVFVAEREREREKSSDYECDLIQFINGCIYIFYYTNAAQGH